MIVTGLSLSAARPIRKYSVVPELPTETSSWRGEKPAAPLTFQWRPLELMSTPSPRSACTVKLTCRASVRSAIVLSPGASAASISARWAWYLDGGMMISPSSGACAPATRRRIRRVPAKSLARDYLANLGEALNLGQRLPRQGGQHQLLDPGRGVGGELLGDALGAADR